MRKPVCVMPYVKNKCAGQPLTCTFVIRCLDGTAPADSITKISRLLITSVAEQSDLIMSWSHNSEDKFSYDVAQLLLQYRCIRGYTYNK